MATFKNLDAVIDHLVKLGWTLDKRFDNNLSFQAITYPGNRVIYVPTPLFGPLFRGQSSVHANCHSSLFRGEFDPISHFYERMKMTDFQRLLEQHPVIKEEEEKGVYVDYVGLAQHYGIKTEVLDLTSTLIVAAFFATTRYENGNYYPITDERQKGVLYFCPPDVRFWGDFTEEWELFPLGLQCFRRPGEQRAYSINLRNKNLHDINGIHRYEFYQDKALSEKIYDVMSGGKKIFPYDTVEQKVQEIQELKEFSRNIFDLTFKRYGRESQLTEDELVDGLATRDISIKEEPRQVNYSKDEMEILLNEKEEGKMYENSYVTSRLAYTPQDNRNPQ